MQDPIEQIYYMIAISKYFILAKETKMRIIKTLLRPLWVPWMNEIYTTTVYGKKIAICIISHKFFCTYNEHTDPISKGNNLESYPLHLQLWHLKHIDVISFAALFY